MRLPPPPFVAPLVPRRVGSPPETPTGLAPHNKKHRGVFHAADTRKSQPETLDLETRSAPAPPGPAQSPIFAHSSWAARTWAGPTPKRRARPPRDPTKQRIPNNARTTVSGVPINRPLCGPLSSYRRIPRVGRIRPEPEIRPRTQPPLTMFRKTKKTAGQDKNSTSPRCRATPPARVSDAPPVFSAHTRLR